MEEIESEKDLEIRIRNNLKDLFSDTDFILLENKDVVDIVILNDNPPPKKNSSLSNLSFLRKVTYAWELVQKMEKVFKSKF